MPELGKLRKITPYCSNCSRDLKFVRVRGKDLLKDPEIQDIEFDVELQKGKAYARPGPLQEEKLLNTLNPPKYLADVEVWVEDQAEEVRCPYCDRSVKLQRFAPEPPPTGPGKPTTQQQLQQALQQMTGQSGGPAFQMQSPTFGQNRGAITALIDSKFSDQELLDILTDLDNAPPPGSSRQDLLDDLMDWLYS